MSKLVVRGYITEGVILALTSFFYVPKGTYDIRMVFDENLCGLNDNMWDPNFMLPPVGNFIMMLGPETNMVGLDIGEMFYKF